MVSIYVTLLTRPNKTESIEMQNINLISHISEL